MSDIFLSYSREDQAIARRFAEAFEREGFSVWWDQALRSGDDYDQVTEAALKGAKSVVVLWSGRSVASRWVRTEAAIAHRNRTLVPVMIEPCERPVMFELTQAADLSGWTGSASDKAWRSLVDDVRQFTGKPESTPHNTLQPAPKKRISTAVWVVPMLLLAAAAAWWVNSARDDTSSGAAADAGTERTTLAVLPFADMSPAHDHEYFSDGLTEELLNQLAHIRGLRVTARTSSFSFKGKNEDMRVIGEQLGVGHILEGSVRKDGNQLRITAQLINAVDGTHLWSQTYDRELSGIFALQEEVSKDVAKALSIKLDLGDLPRAEGGTTDVEAYDRYLQARTLYQKNGRAESLQSAQLLREAVALDPGFSRAWMLLSYTLFESLLGVPESEARSVREEAAAAIERVLQQTPNAWGAHLLRAGQGMARRDWKQAEASVNAAIAAGARVSSDYEMTISYGGFLRNVGRVGEAAQVFEQARDVDPLSLYVSSDLQQWLDAAGRATDARAEYLRSRPLAGNHQQSNLFALMRILADAKPDAAVIRAQFRRTLEEERLRMPLTHALAEKFTNPIEAREAISKAIEDPANQDRVRMVVVSLYADRFGDKELTLAALRRAVIDFGAVNALWNHFVTGPRADPRFKQLLRETGLAEYFRSTGRWGDFCEPVGADDFRCH